MGGVARHIINVFLIVFAVLSLAGRPIYAEGKPGSFKLVNTMHVGGEGGWDHLTVDSQHRLLYVTRTTHTLVLDAATGKTIADIPGQQRNHDVAIVPEIKRGFISDSKEGCVFIFDLETNTVLGKVEAEGADPLIYDASSGNIFVSCGDAGALASFPANIDPKVSKADARVPLGGKTKYLATDGRGRIFVNVMDKNEVAVVDAKAMTVIGRWPTAPGGSPVAMALDADRHRLFVGCRNPQKLVIISTDDGRLLASLPIGVGVDGMALDGGDVLASCRCRLVVVRETAPQHFKVVQTVKTTPNTRTMGVDTVFHEVFIPSAEFDAPIRAEAKPVLKPDSFTMLVVRRRPVSSAFREWNFDTDKTGRFPKGWTFSQTKAGAIAPVWQVVAAPKAPSGSRVLGLVETKSEKRTYNLAIAPDAEFKDLDLRMKLRKRSGTIDQGGGPVWRYKDENNYYVCRFNPLENNFRLYYVLNAKRTQIGSVDVKTAADAWHEINVRMIGNLITCYMDGVKLLEVKDDTLSAAGKVGLWTKADAASEFDDLTVRGLDK